MAIYARPFVADTIKDLNAMQRKHLPFVLAKTLTQTAKGAAGRVKMRTRQEFKLHSEFIPRGIRIRPAQKADLVRYGFIEADVHTAPLISGFMPLHETGGTKRPHATGMKDRGASLALPASGVTSRAFKTRSGRVRKRWKPKELLKAYNEGLRYGPGSRVSRSGKGGRRKAFITRSSTGTPIIVRRRSKARLPLEVLYSFIPRAQIDASWRFEPTVRRYVSFAIDKKFQRNMSQAIRS